MYEELIEPFKLCFKYNSFLDFSKNVKTEIYEKFGRDIFEKMYKLQDDFYIVNKDVTLINHDFETVRNEVERNFLQLYPNICKEILDMLTVDYYYNCVMH